MQITASTPTQRSETRQLLPPKQPSNTDKIKLFIQPQTVSPIPDSVVEEVVVYTSSPLVKGSKLNIRILQARLILEDRVVEVLGVLEERGPALRVSLIGSDASSCRQLMKA